MFCKLFHCGNSSSGILVALFHWGSDSHHNKLKCTAFTHGAPSSDKRKLFSNYISPSDPDRWSSHWIGVEGTDNLTFTITVILLCTYRYNVLHNNVFIHRWPLNELHGN